MPCRFPFRVALVLLALWLPLPDAGGARPAAVESEIHYLIERVAASNDRFVRNEKEYSSREAADHLRQKLSSAGDRVKTSEDFITAIATKSYLTGKPYTLKRSDGSEVAAALWLSKILAEHRAKTQRR